MVNSNETYTLTSGVEVYNFGRRYGNIKIFFIHEGLWGIQLFSRVQWEVMSGGGIGLSAIFK